MGQAGHKWGKRDTYGKEAKGPTNDGARAFPCGAGPWQIRTCIFICEVLSSQVLQLAQVRRLPAERYTFLSAKVLSHNGKLQQSAPLVPHLCPTCLLTFPHGNLQLHVGRPCHMRTYVSMSEGKQASGTQAGQVGHKWDPRGARVRRTCGASRAQVGRTWGTSGAQVGRKWGASGAPVGQMAHFD